MIEFDEIIEGIKTDYQWFEKNRRNENAGQIDHRLYTQQIFKMCDDAIQNWVTRHHYRFADRYRTLLFLRYCEGDTLQQIGQQLNLSRERVRQLELKLLKILRDYFRKTCPEDFQDRATKRSNTFRISPQLSKSEHKQPSPSGQLKPDWKGAMP